MIIRNKIRNRMISARPFTFSKSIGDIKIRMVKFRVRVCLALIPCREIETLKEKDSFIHREKREIYI